MFAAGGELRAVAGSRRVDRYVFDESPTVFMNSRSLLKSAPGDGELPARDGTPVFGGAFLSPVMVVKQAAIDHNVAAMAQFCTEAGVLLAPHGKTTMSPELIGRQLAAGAWGLSAATVAQVRAFRSFGVANVLLANELTDPAGIDWIVRDQLSHPGQGFLCYVDSLDGVRLLESQLASTVTTRAIDVLVEVAPTGARTGCRTVDDARRVAQRVADSAHLRLVGVAGYEGALGGSRSAGTIRKVAGYCRFLGAAATALDSDGLFGGDQVLLSAGGGVFFDIVVSELATWRPSSGAVQLIIRPGSYITHDDGLYAQMSAFAQPGARYSLRPALEIWGRVLSRPEPGLAFLDFGRRDVPFDQGLPMPHTVRAVDGAELRPATGFSITALNDQHAYLSIDPNDPIRPGEWVGCGVSHPCTAFDKWRYLPLVDDEYRCVGSVTTYF